MLVPLFAVFIFIACSYKARLVWYRDPWPKKFMALFWGGCALGAIILCIFAAISPKI